MGKKKNSIIGKVLVCIVIVLLVVILFMLNPEFNFTNTGLPKADDIEGITYEVNDYIDLEKVDFGFETDRLKVERVIFKNLDVSIVNEFYDKQNRFIELAEDSYNYFADFNFEGVSSNEGIVAYSDIWYQVNGEILTIYYELNFEEAIGECNEIAVINIDLKNKKIVSNEELLKFVDTSFEDIALEHYNST